MGYAEGLREASMVIYLMPGSLMEAILLDTKGQNEGRASKKIV